MVRLMKHCPLWLAWFALLTTFVGAQTNQVTASQVIMPVNIGNLTPATQASVSLSGNPGPQTIYYWMVSNFVLGSSSPVGPFVIQDAASTLSSSRYVQISPVYPANVLSIDLLKSLSPIPPSGACACAVATGVTSGAINDQSNSTSAYTVSPVNVSAFTMTLTNEVQATGSTHLILRQNGAFVADLSTGGGTGSPFQSLTTIGTSGPATLIAGVLNIPQYSGGGGFSITGFSGGSTVEIGATVTNPGFTASYSSLPSSASISNTDGIDSPLTLTTPFTSGTVVGSFVKTIQTSTTFTLSATSGTTATATQAIAWVPRSFGGAGTPGATSSVTASGNAAVLSTGDVLANAGLASSDVGATYGPYTASAQSIYLLLIGGSHTIFKDAVTGFAFPFNSPTSVSFVNQNGSTVPMYLYQSTNTLTGPYSVLVVN